MNRRKLLTASGAMVALPLAGCTAGDDENDETEEENNGSGNGDGSEEENNGSGNGDGSEEEEPLVEVLEHEFDRARTLPAVVGTLENVSGEELSSVNVNVDFLDEDEVLIGEGLANTFDLAADRVWEFEASYTGEESHRIENYELETDARL